MRLFLLPVLTRIFSGMRVTPCVELRTGKAFFFHHTTDAQNAHEWVGRCEVVYPFPSPFPLEPSKMLPVEFPSGVEELRYAIRWKDICAQCLARGHRIKEGV